MKRSYRASVSSLKTVVVVVTLPLFLGLSLIKDVHADSRSPVLLAANPSTSSSPDYGQKSSDPKDSSKEMTSEDIKAMQQALNKNGEKLKVDGKMDHATKVALEKYQKSKGLKMTGKLDAETKQMLLGK